MHPIMQRIHDTLPEKKKDQLTGITERQRKKTTYTIIYATNKNTKKLPEITAFTLGGFGIHIIQKHSKLGHPMHKWKI